jgi:DNA adenine methylase
MAAQPRADRRYAGVLTPDADLRQRRKAVQPTSAPFPYFGGKQAMVPQLLQLLPPHTVYVEVFGGAASLLFGKRPADLEVYNDIDSMIVNFFRVLRTPDEYAELIRRLELTPYSREERQLCYTQLTDGDDPIEHARRWFTAIYQSFSCTLNKNSWRHSTSQAGGNNPPRGFANATAHLRACAERMRYVQIEHESFERLIRAYDAEDVLLYADPPYVPETRRGGGYRHEMTEAQHRQLLEIITTCKSMVILSGYDAPLYQEYLADWRMIRVETFAHAAGHTRATGLRGKGASKRQARTECIWVKPNTEVQPTLWNREVA